MLQEFLLFVLLNEFVVDPYAPEFTNVPVFRRGGEVGHVDDHLRELVLVYGLLVCLRSHSFFELGYHGKMLEHVRCEDVVDCLLSQDFELADW